jgi:cell division protein DivIC
VEIAALDDSSLAQASDMAGRNNPNTEEISEFYSQAILEVKVRRIFSLRHTEATPNPTNRGLKGSKRRLRLLMILVACFMCWAAVTAFTQFGKLQARSLVVKNLNTQLEDAKKINADTKREITRLNDKEYIEQKIRQDLHFTKPGETIFFTPKTNP